MIDNKLNAKKIASLPVPEEERIFVSKDTLFLFSWKAI